MSDKELKMKKYSVSLVYWKDKNAKEMEISLTVAVVGAKSENEALSGYISECAVRYSDYRLCNHAVIEITT